ncbi:MAG: T9SS C-terminal target domain-containing protein [Calditrichaeota bacterium]|nr:MAG: T9SS C-terminal target domain-containing protein [Calditrichota bacterium]
MLRQFFLILTLPLTLSAQETKIQPNDTSSGDFFGQSVDCWQNFAVASSPKNLNLGAVYIFEKLGMNWNETTKLTASDGSLGDDFGTSVSIESNLVVVGSQNDSTGSVYIFEKQNSTWNEAAKLIPNDGQEFDKFGSSVSISGSFIAIGSKDNDTNGNNSGAVYIFEKVGNSWVQNSKITASDGSANDRFGNSVKIENDFLVVGASGNSDFGGNSGSAYIFRKIGSSWIEEAKLLPNDGQLGAFFGNSVSISDSTVLVGAFRDFKNGIPEGSAYIFQKSGNIWSQEAKLEGADITDNDFFGSSVEIKNDLAFVGTYWGKANGIHSGTVYIFEKSGNLWNFESKLSASDGASLDHFGGSVAFDNGNLLVGAAYDDDNGMNSGSAYIYDLNSVVSVNEGQNLFTPKGFTLEQNFPNPFNPTTTINYELETTFFKNAKIQIFNVLGRKIREFKLINPKGSVVWNGEDISGNRVASGIYFYRLKFGKKSKIRKMILLK